MTSRFSTWVAAGWVALSSSALLAQDATKEPQFKLRSGQLSAAAHEIDSLVQTALAKQGEQPNAIVDDRTFLRRTYLNVIGRIPNLRETEEFLKSNNPAKRRRLIDDLLMSNGHVSHMFNYWADVLRAKTRLAQQTSGAPYMQFIKDSVAQNLSYDEFVRQLLTADGAAHAPDNGSTGYYLRDRGMPEDNMANTVRIFLGTRLECAQCHNHPFDKWTQKQFFEMAAFTGGIQFRQDARQSSVGRKIQEMARSVRNEYDQNGQRAFRRILRGVLTGIQGTGTGVAQLPKDYQYDDGKPGDLIVANTMFGADVDLNVKLPDLEKARKRRKGRRNRPQRRRKNRVRLKEIGSREQYADWLTSCENPRFTTVIANRMWKRVMGRGLIEPVDDMKDDTVAAIPRLMKHLESLMIEVDYDLREFQRVLLNTKVAQRATPKQEPDLGEPYYFAGPLLRRLSAEQIWDSMLTLVVHEVDSTIGRTDPAKQVTDRYERFFAMSDEDLKEQIDLGVLRQTNPDEFRRRARQMRSKQNKQRRDSVTTARKRARPLIRQLQRARRDGDFAREEEVLEKLEKAGLLDVLRRANRSLVRASELQSPAPDGHFLRQFGQSDREQIEASFTTATVPQALALINGFVERYVLRAKESPVMLAMARRKSASAKIRAAYLSILNREPTGSETAMWRRDIEKLGTDGCRDLIWTLVNSHEFRFVL